MKLMVYNKKVVMPRGGLAGAVEELRDWRGPRSGKRFVTISVFLPPHPKHLAHGLREDQVLIIARTE
jgi:hypothetical protein